MEGLTWLPPGEEQPGSATEGTRYPSPGNNYRYPEPPEPPQRDLPSISYELGPIVEAQSDRDSDDSVGEGFDSEAEEDQRILDALLADQDDPYLDPNFFSGDDGDDTDFLDPEEEAVRPATKKRGRPKGSQNSRTQPVGKRRKISLSPSTSPARGRSKRGGNKRRKPRKLFEPSEDIKRLLAKATAAHLRKDTEETIDYCLEIIHQNPEVWAAHSLYSEALQSQGKFEDSLKVLENGCAYITDPILLWDIVLRFQQLVTDTTPNRHERLNSLLSQIITVMPHHMEARRLRMELSEKQEHYNKAVKEGLIILAKRPWDLEALRDVCMIAAKDRSSPSEALPKAFEAAIKHYKRAEGAGSVNRFDFNMLNIYMELLFRMKDFAGGAKRLRSVARWLLGREEEQFWDDVVDDREYDMIAKSRRATVPGFVEGKFDSETYGEGLPIELRIRLGLFRLNMGNDEESKRHFNVLYIDEIQAATRVTIFADLFGEVGDNLRRLGRHEEALKFYLPMKGVPEVDHVGLHENMAYCYKAIGAYDKAAEALEQYLNGGPNAALARLQLAEIYEHLGEVEKATEHASWVKSVKGHWMRKEPVLQRLLREELSIRPPRVVKPSPRKQRLDARNMDENDEEDAADPPASGILNPLPPLRSLVRTKTTGFDAMDESDIPVYMSNMIRSQMWEAYDKLIELQGGVDEDDESSMRRWQDIAPAMTDHFASVQMFYRERRRGVRWTGFERNSSQKDYTEEVIDKYHDISFDAWLSVFCRTALVQAKLSIKARPGQVVARYAEDSDDEPDRAANDATEVDREEDGGVPKRGTSTEYSRTRTKRQRDTFTPPQVHEEASQVMACWVTLANADNAQPFNCEERRLERIRLVSLVCGLLLDDEQHVCEDTRMLIKSMPFCAEPMKLYHTLSRLYSSGRRVWINAGPHQKYFLRAIKQMDFALLDEGDRKLFKFSDTERRSWTAGSANGNPHNLTELNVPLMVLHAHLLFVGGATPSALYYYYRLHAMLPDDPILFLSISNCYCELAQRRLTDNRLYWVQHALAFFDRYYNIRIKSERAIHRQEAEFNRGRFWYALGLQHLCVRHFERVMDMAEEVRRQQLEVSGGVGGGAVENFAPDAAFALSTILSLSGDALGARRLREKYLVLD